MTILSFIYGGKIRNTFTRNIVSLTARSKTFRFYPFDHQKVNPFVYVANILHQKKVVHCDLMRTYRSEILLTARCCSTLLVSLLSYQIFVTGFNIYLLIVLIHHIYMFLLICYYYESTKSHSHFPPFMFKKFVSIVLPCSVNILSG